MPHQQFSYDDFIKEKIASGKYWLLIAGSLEWQYVMAKLEEEFFVAGRDDLSVYGALVPEDPCLPPIYWMKKTAIPAEVIAHRVGLPVDVVKKAKIIKLRPFPEGPVKPTVEYFGTA